MIIYIHCMHGHDRTSEVIIPYLINKKRSDGSSMYGTISDAVNETQVQGSSQIDFKYKKLKQTYGYAASSSDHSTVKRQAFSEESGKIDTFVLL